MGQLWVVWGMQAQGALAALGDPCGGQWAARGVGRAPSPGTRKRAECTVHVRCAERIHRPPSAQVDAAQAFKEKGNAAYKQAKLKRAARLYDKVGPRAVPQQRHSSTRYGDP